MFNEFNDYVLWGLIAVIIVGIAIYVRNHPVKVKRELANARDAFNEATAALEARKAELEVRFDERKAELEAEAQAFIADAKVKLDAALAEAREFAARIAK